MNYSNEINREIIIDHVQKPRNQRTENYLSRQLKNPTCGDVITLYVDYQKNQIKDICYQASGCSLCVASTSIMSQLVKNKNKQEIKMIIDQFLKMLTDKAYNQKLLGDANCFEGVKKIGPRIKCVTLPYKALQEIIGEKDGRL